MFGQSQKLKEIEIKIESVRYELNETGIKWGLQHPKTIQLSKDLDALLNEYQLLIELGPRESRNIS